MESQLQKVARLTVGLAESLHGYPPTRERSLALTKLEECLMWVERADALPPMTEAPPA